MLRHHTDPRSSTLRQIQPKINALHDGRLHTRLKNVVKIMGP
jgi:hypothetical protein